MASPIVPVPAPKKFRFDKPLDLALCRLYMLEKPTTKTDWEKLAARMPGDPTFRNCKEHMELLLKNFKAKERQSRAA